MRQPMAAFDFVALWLGRAVLALLGAVLVQQTALRLVRRMIHFPAPAFISVFLDSPFRKALQPPGEGLARAGVGATPSSSGARPSGSIWRARPAVCWNTR